MVGIEVKNDGPSDGVTLEGQEKGLVESLPELTRKSEYGGPLRKGAALYEELVRLVHGLDGAHGRGRAEQQPWQRAQTQEKGGKAAHEP